MRLPSERSADTPRRWWRRLRSTCSNRRRPGSGSGKALHQGFTALRNGGTVALLGLPSKPVEIDLANDIIFKRIVTTATALGFAGALGSLACLEHTAERGLPAQRLTAMPTQAPEGAPTVSCQRKRYARPNLGRTPHHDARDRCNDMRVAEF